MRLHELEAPAAVRCHATDRRLLEDIEDVESLGRCRDCRECCRLKRDVHRGIMLVDQRHGKVAVVQRPARPHLHTSRRVRREPVAGFAEAVLIHAARNNETQKNI